MMSAVSGTERILEATRLIERTFTTGSSRYVRRGNQTIRHSCLEFMSFLRKEGYSDSVRLEEAKRLFQDLFGPKDRTTLKAYFGVQPGESCRTIERLAEYASGTKSLKTIKLTQKLEKRTGYLEFLRLVTFEEVTLELKRRRETIWYMVINSETSVVPEIAKSSTRVSEACVVSNDDFSLTPKDHGQPKAERNDSGQPSTILRLQRRERVLGRERNRLSESNLPQQETREIVSTPWLTPTQKATVEERDRKRQEVLDRDLVQQLEKSVKK
jgi:hypothetical protein